MSNGTHDPLGSLSLRYTVSFNADNKAKIDELYAYYIRDFFDLPFNCNGAPVKIREHLYVKTASDGLPDFYRTYHEKFVHLITRESPGRTVMMPNRRIFKENRANRIHWIKPILENWKDPRITYFHYTESDGALREYFWYKAVDYIVILEKVRPNYFLVTAFCVDHSNRRYFEGKYAGRCGP